jgi:hypothetical protein
MAARKKATKRTKARKTPALKTREFYITVEGDAYDDGPLTIFENDPGPPDGEDGWGNARYGHVGEELTPCKDGVENMVGFTFNNGNEHRLYKVRLVPVAEDSKEGFWIIRKGNHLQGNVQVQNYKPYEMLKNGEEEEQYPENEQDWMTGYKAFQAISGIALKTGQTIKAKLELLAIGHHVSRIEWKALPQRKERRKARS